MNEKQLQIIKEIEKEIEVAKSENKTRIESKVRIFWTDNFEVKAYFEHKNIYVYPCIDSTLDGHYILDWSGCYKVEPSDDYSYEK